MKLRLMVVVVLAFAALAGCGDDEQPPEPRETSGEWADPRGERKARDGVLAVQADPGGAPAFQQDALEAAAGRVTLELVNPSSTSHSLCVDAAQQGALGCTGTFRGDRGTLRLRLEPGRYTFFCNVPGHRAAGMSGSLTVQ
jgi:plastocyanin